MSILVVDDIVERIASSIDILRVRFATGCSLVRRSKFLFAQIVEGSRHHTRFVHVLGVL